MNDVDRALITILGVMISILLALLVYQGNDLQDIIREQQTIHEEYDNGR